MPQQGWQRVLYYQDNTLVRTWSPTTYRCCFKDTMDGLVTGACREKTVLITHKQPGGKGRGTHDLIADRSDAWGTNPRHAPLDRVFQQKMFPDPLVTNIFSGGAHKKSRVRFCCRKSNFLPAKNAFFSHQVPALPSEKNAGLSGDKQYPSLLGW